jgi:pilus assembly protein CpaC
VFTRQFLVVAALSVAAALSAIPSHAQTPLPTRIDMFIGDTRVIEASTRRVAVGNGQVVSMSTVGPSQLLVLANAPGVSSVTLWLRDGRQHKLTVHVTEANLDVASESIRNMLQGTQNISVRAAGNKILLEGDRVSDADQQRVAAITESFGGLVMNFVGKVGWEQMIYFDVRIVEVRRNAVRELGIRWNDRFNGPNVGVIADFDTNDLFRVVPNLGSEVGNVQGLPLPRRVWPPQVYSGLTTVIGSRIEALEQRGDAQIIAQPTLSCRSGGSARFVSGGEVPIPIVDGLGSTDVEFKEYGIILDVKPVADRSGSIYAQLDTEVSQIDPSVSVLGVPGFLKRQSKAEINMREGETIALAGLVNRQRSNDRQQVPGLGSVPVVGNLFRTNSKRNLETELIVLITPRIVQGTPNPEIMAVDPNAQLVERASELAPKAGGQFQNGRLQVLD